MDFLNQKFVEDNVGEFTDPVVKCVECQELILVATLHHIGACPSCGNTRVRNVNKMREEDYNKLIQWQSQGKVSQEFIDLFEVKETKGSLEA